jgi:hypothetical protein
MRARPSNGNGLGDHGHGQDAHLLGHFRHDRGRAGAGAAAHAGGDEHHVGAFQHFGDALAILQRGLATDSGFAPAPRPLVTLPPSCSIGARPRA